MLTERESQRSMTNLFTSIEGGEVTTLMTARAGAMQRQKKEL